MKYSKRITLSKSVISSLQALAAVAVSLGSMWACSKYGIVLDAPLLGGDEATKGSLVIIISSMLMGLSEGIRNWYKHRQ